MIAGFTIGVDVGGTWLRIAAVKGDGEILARNRIAMSTIEQTADEFLSHVERGISAEIGSLSKNEHSCAGIGVALPGILDATYSKLQRSINLPFLRGIPLRRMLHDRFRVPVVLTTDAQACCWAEYCAHEQQAACFVHLRFGTGIGCAVARRGRVDLLDRDGFHHPTLLVVERDDQALACPCGLRGCLETVASGLALRSGDIERAAQAAGAALLQLTDHYRPDVICLGGGLLEHRCDFHQRLERVYWEKAAQMAKPPNLVNVRLGDDAGVVGAAKISRLKPSNRGGSRIQ